MTGEERRNEGRNEGMKEGDGERNAVGREEIGIKTPRPVGCRGVGTPPSDAPER